MLGNQGEDRMQSSFRFVGLLVVPAIWLMVSQAGFCADAWYSRGGMHYEQRVPFVLSNPLPLARIEEPVILPVAELRKQAPGFPGKSFVVVDSGAAADSPCGIEAGGNDAPSQADDLDGDGAPDELVFLASLGPNEAKTYHVYYTGEDAPPPLYPKRTQIVDFTRTDANTLWAIESDVLAFRFNLPSGGGPGFVGDVLAKNRQFPGYSLHLFDPLISGVRVLVGRCDPPDAVGIGSVLAWHGGAWQPARGAGAKTEARRLIDGRVRSVGEIETTGWLADGGRYGVKARYSMYAGQRYLRCDLAVTAEQGQGGRFAIGLMKLENEKSDIDVAGGRLSLWGDRPAINAKDLGLAALFGPRDVKGVAETPGGRVIELKDEPAAGNPLRATLYLSAGCKDEKKPASPYENYAYWWPDLGNTSYGDFHSEKDFFALHALLARKASAPLAAAIGKLESNPVRTAKKPFEGGDFFLANPANKPSQLPGELDLDLLGMAPADGLEPGENGIEVDAMNLDGAARVFVRKAVGPASVERFSLRPGRPRADESGIKLEAARGDEAGVWVSTVSARWLLTGSGLRKVSIGGKDLAIEQPGASGTVKVMHQGPVASVVRVGGERERTDFYFFKGTDIVRVVANHAIGFCGKEARSYVGKKAMYVAGCECTEASPWGRWSSDAVFTKESVFYPAEWSALCRPDEKAGLVCYGSPSAPEIVVEKGGKLASRLAAGGRRQELYLAPIQDIDEADGLWQVMSRPFVLARHASGFACLEDRNGNGVRDTFHVTDRNRNGMPDFDGDRWAFDVDSDDALQMVIEFEAEPRRMSVYCDTVSGTAFHSNHLGHYFGDQPPTWGGSPPHHKFDGCLSPAELEEPFYVYESIGDGFFKGPLTAGGFIASGRATALRDGPILGVSLPKHEMLTSLDLDGDGDCDIWTQDGPSVTQNNGMLVCGKHDRYVNYCVVDLSDSNLEPLTVVNPYTGLAYYAIRYFSFLMLDNSKIYQGGCIDGGVITGGQNWPQAGTWDIDNDGVAEGYIYHEMTHTLGLDLAKKRTVKDQWVKERQHLQRDLFEEKITLPTDFGVLTPWPWDLIDSNPLNKGARKTGGLEMRPLMLPVGSFPVNTYTDPHGNKVSICADFLPGEWHGERLECGSWPDGQWDYRPRDNWNSFVRQKYRYVRVNFWRPGLDNGGDHEGVNTQMLTWPNPMMRSEVDADGTSSFYLYESPFLNGLHYKGLEFGLQCMHDNDPRMWPMPPAPEVYSSAKPLAEWVNDALYAEEYANDYGIATAYDYLPSARQAGRMFLYYRDEDRDGYADVYLLDDENDGTFEKRVWYQKTRGVLSVCDGGAFGVAARKLEFPGCPLELKNYEKLVEMYRQRLARPGLLRQAGVRAGRCENTGAEFSAVLGDRWLPRVAVDAVHAAGKDLLRDFGPSGFDTLGRVLAESPLHVKALATAFSPETLAGIDVLVVGRLDSALSNGERQALEEYLRQGGVLLILLGDGSEGGTSALAEMSARFGVKIGEKKLRLVPGQCRWSEILPGLKEAAGGNLLEGVAPVFLEAWDVECPIGARTLLEYRGHPLIVEAPRGRGRVLVVPSNVFANGFMCLPAELRRMPFQPGNQALAKNLVKHLLGGLMPRIEAMESGPSEARMQIHGRGGEIRFQVPWGPVLVRLDGKDLDAETKDGLVVIQAPPGGARIELMHRP